VWDEPLGESLEALGERVQRVLDKLPDGDVLIFAHGHVLRVLTALYLGGTPAEGKHFLLDAARIGVLAQEHGYPALKAWNL
jgi:broad specificity phosphatase PhoE